MMFHLNVFCPYMTNWIGGKPNSTLVIFVRVVVSKLQQWEQIERRESCNMTAE
ncbi:hypothetical protein SLEP1_g36719 [Rubroshorea leprosula]|uniref:Uncharacterized protein n=1 Tax=Rubroshorea leprosula TaxID=152421 RepID=A0AAV5KSJ1_9ROSI|nr:hypothetical protein SLEP1_g36719 [Rubroshorea leprosula]